MGRAKVEKTWQVIDTFYVEKLDQSFLTCGLSQFVPNEAVEVMLTVHRCYLNRKHGTEGEIFIGDVHLYLDDLQN